MHVLLFFTVDKSDMKKTTCMDCSVNQQVVCLSEYKGQRLSMQDVLLKE